MNIVEKMVNNWEKLDCNLEKLVYILEKKVSSLAMSDCN